MFFLTNNLRIQELDTFVFLLQFFFENPRQSSTDDTTVEPSSSSVALFLVWQNPQTLKAQSPSSFFSGEFSRHFHGNWG